MFLFCNRSNRLIKVYEKDGTGVLLYNRSIDETRFPWPNIIKEECKINKSQINYLSDCGNFYIVIAENKKIEDFFDLEEINDEEYMDFHFSMCDVGDKYGNPDRYKSEE